MSTPPDEFLVRLRLIIDAVEIESPAAFFLGGVRRVAGDAVWQVGANGVPIPLASALQNELYARCYMRRFDPNAMLSAGASKDITAELDAANATVAGWDGGWRITRVGVSGQAVVEKNGNTRQPWPGEYVTQNGFGGPPVAGGMVSLPVQRGSGALQPGFYFAFGQALLAAQDDADSQLRFYFNISPDGAAKLVGELTGRLNQFQVPFRLKCLSERALFPRSDAMVLYVARRFFRVAAELAMEARGAMGSEIGDQWPLFTRRLADGLGFAEDPVTFAPAELPPPGGNLSGVIAPLSESFGSNRCRLLANALVSAWMTRQPGGKMRVGHVLGELTKAGVDLESPHLMGTSNDIYALPPDVM